MVKIEPDVSYLALDTETTGTAPKDGDRIIELGAVEFRNGILTGRKFQSFLNPEGRLVGDSERIHKRSDAFLTQFRTFAEVVDEFLEFCGDCPLVIHNASFDLDFLDAECARLKLPPFRQGRTVIDTYRVAQTKYPRQPNNLDALCDRHKVDRSRRDKEGHGALIDSELLAEVTMKMFGVWGLSHAFVTRDVAVVAGPEVVAARIELPLRQVIVVGPDEAELARHSELITKLKNPIWNSAVA